MLEQDLLNNNYGYILISTTAKHDTKILRLPNRIINGEKSANILISDEGIARYIFKLIDGIIPIALVDVEQKQSINLFKIAKEIFIKTIVLQYKPNDITVEASDQLLLNHFSSDLTHKKILICGTGNISTKLAIRFAERQANVFIMGRKRDKANHLIESINMILPSYTTHSLSYFDSTIQYDAILSFVSAENVIDHHLANVLENFSIAVDGGIGNFTDCFIAETKKRNIRTLRLDVRIAEPFLSAGVRANNDPFFYEVMGEKEYKNIKIVAGGIIGSEGAVIVDRLKEPTQLIGIANGTGGVKSESDLTNGEKKSLAIINKLIVQNRKKIF